MLHDRLRRDENIRKGAKKLEKIATNRLKSALIHYSQQPSNHSLMRKKIFEIRKAKQQVGHHIKRTMNLLNEEKLAANANFQLVQERQRTGLTKLKKRIDDQFQSMQAASEARKVRIAKEEYEKELLRAELVSSGHNPYVVDHLLKVEERKLSIREKFEEQEQARLSETLRLQELELAAQAKEVVEKKKWAQFWAKKVRQKIIQKQRKEREMYYDSIDPENVLTVVVDEHPHHHHHEDHEKSKVHTKSHFDIGDIAHHPHEHHENNHHGHVDTHHHLEQHEDIHHSAKSTRHSMSGVRSSHLPSKQMHHITSHLGDHLSHHGHKKSGVHHLHSHSVTTVYRASRESNYYFSAPHSRTNTKSSSGSSLSVHRISSKGGTGGRKSNVFPFSWSPSEVVFKVC